jgi:hypothetical protein
LLGPCKQGIELGSTVRALGQRDHLADEGRMDQADLLAPFGDSGQWRTSSLNLDEVRQFYPMTPRGVTPMLGRP